MKRGRKQDDTLPPSRSREIQRAFRQRRADYIAGLEQRVRELEGETDYLRSRLGEPRLYDAGVEPPPGGPYPLLNVEDAKGRAKAKSYLAALGAATRQNASAARPTESGPSSTGGDEQALEDVSIERSISPLSPTSNAGGMPLEFDSMTAGMARSAPAATAFLPRQQSAYDMPHSRPGEYPVHLSHPPMMGSGMVGIPASSRPSLASSTTSTTSHTPISYPHSQNAYHDHSQHYSQHQHPQHQPAPVPVHHSQPTQWTHHLAPTPEQQQMQHHPHMHRPPSMNAGQPPHPSMQAQPPFAPSERYSPENQYAHHPAPPQHWRPPNQGSHPEQGQIKQEPR